jgi:DNA-directed RNA polymerase specialized sigma subunit
MSKEKFVEMVMESLSSEYDLNGDELKKYQPAIEAAHDSESGVTEDQLAKLFSGVDESKTRELAEKFPKLNAVSLDESGGDEDDEEEDDEDDDEEEDDEEEDDDEDEG